MTTLTDTHGMVALVQAATTLPIMLFSLAAGALADNFNRRNIMLGAQIFMMSVSVILTILAFAGFLSPWLLLFFTFLIGCGIALHNPSWQASMGDLVPREDLPAAVTLNGVGFNLMRSIGPAFGGMIVALAGTAFAFLLNALSYIALVRALFRWQPPRVQRSLPRESFGSAMLAGIRYVSMSPNLLKVIGRGTIYGFSAIAVLALLPVIVRDALSGNAFTYGVLLGCFGVGAIIGALLNNRVRALWHNETIVRGTCLVSATSILLMAFSRDVWLTGLVLLPAGASWLMTLSLFNVTVQLSTPRWVVGRALAMYQTTTFGGMAVGSWVWGEMADWQHVEFALVACAVVLILACVLGLRYNLPEFGTLNLDPLNRFHEPELQLQLSPRSGPIMIMVDYEIAQQDISAFLHLMLKRRRIRLRDGARQWGLLRDLENPNIWIETYHVPTWVEYVRHNQRRTQADADVMEALLKLHRSKNPPRVHRMIERQTVPVRDDTPLKGEHADIP